MSTNEASSGEGTRVASWIEMMEDRAEEEENERLRKVAENFRYFVTNLDEWESGDFDYSNLPNFKEELKWATKRCVLFGSQLAVTNAGLYVVTGAENRFIGLYGHEENAVNRASECPELEYEQVTPTARSPSELISPLLQADGSGPNAVGRNLQYLLDNEEGFLSGEVTSADLPDLDDDASALMIYAVLFGMLWEYSYPGLSAVFNRDRFCELYYSKQEAEQEADSLGPEHHAQRVAVVDGDVGPEDVIPELTEVA